MLNHHDRTAWIRGGLARCIMPHSDTGKPMRMVLLGAPGVGKGTQAELLCDKLGSCHLSTGDVLRAAKSLNEQQRSPSMESAIEYMKRGELVPDSTIISMIKERMRCLKCGGGFLLDGFPRTVSQAKDLDVLLQQEGVELDAVIDYELPLDQIVARLSGRRTCASCRAVCHLAHNPPKIAGVCDHCGGKLSQRDDDTPDAIKVRMAAYEAVTKPLIKFYEARGLLITIAADGTPENIFNRTISRLGFSSSVVTTG